MSQVPQYKYQDVTTVAKRYSYSTGSASPATYKYPPKSYSVNGVTRTAGLPSRGVSYEDDDSDDGCKTYKYTPTSYLVNGTRRTERLPSHRIVRSGVNDEGDEAQREEDEEDEEEEEEDEAEQGNEQHEEGSNGRDTQDGKHDTASTEHPEDEGAFSGEELEDDDPGLRSISKRVRFDDSTENALDEKTANTRESFRTKKRSFLGFSMNTRTNDKQIKGRTKRRNSLDPTAPNAPHFPESRKVMTRSGLAIQTGDELLRVSKKKTR